jgi:subtilisin family serine protease
MKNLSIIVFTIVLICALSGYFRTNSKAQIFPAQPQVETFRQKSFGKLINSAKQTGTARVIVGIQTNFIPEGNLAAPEQSKQRQDIKRAQDDFLDRLQFFRVNDLKRYEYIPYLAFETDAATLEQMQRDSLIFTVHEDEIAEPALAESTGIVGAPTAWNAGFSGSGQTIAVIDSGVDKNHPFLNGKVISEACYSSNIPGSNSTSVCPNGAVESTETNSGLHCPNSVAGCAHGTNVAGIAAGRGSGFSGVAKDANLIAIQIFSKIENQTTCGTSPSPCGRYWTSDLLKGLERVRTLKNTINIAAVNVSLQTGQQFASNCDVQHSPTKAAIDNLRSVGVAAIICSGNYSYTNALTAPACISTAISVGSTDDGSSGTTGDSVSSFSDSSPLLHLLAPGRWINSSIPGGVYQNYSGTSMAAPHVAGAFAILKQRNPNATIEQILGALTTTGQPITDARNGIIKPRIKIAAALNAIATRRSPFDFDGDGKTDISIFRPTLGEWWYLRSFDGINRAFQFGGSSDKVVPADYTGDGKTDVAFWRPTTGEWFVLRSEDNSFYSFPFGAAGDVPAPADYDGDGKADPAVFRPSNTTWFISRSSGGTTIQQFGTSGDVPAVADYDGDGKSDIAIYRPSLGQWWLSRSTAGAIAFQFGTSTDKPVQGDYTGDGKADVAFWRPASGEWFILRSEDNSFYSFPFGANGDVAAPGDYDGDGKADAAVLRPASNTWFAQRSTSGTMIQNFGINGDIPVASAFVP